MPRRLSQTYLLIRESLVDGPRSRDEIVAYVRPHILLGVGARAAERRRAVFTPGHGRVRLRALHELHAIGVRGMVNEILPKLCSRHTVERLPDGTFKWIR